MGIEEQADNKLMQQAAKISFFIVTPFLLRVLIGHPVNYSLPPTGTSSSFPGIACHSPPALKTLYSLMCRLKA